MRRLTSPRVLLLALAVTLGAAVPALAAAPAAPAAVLKGAEAHYAGHHFGEGNLPAGCIEDRDESNPDNSCFHMRVGLNALDSPEVNVAVLVPVSPTAERDLRIMRQAVEMWGGGIDQLAEQMGLDWLAKGVNVNVTTKLVPVDANGVPTQAIRLVQPKIVVIASNPAGGIGIGVDPVDLVGQLGIVDAQGVPCASFEDPFDMGRWQQRPGFDGHHAALGGIFVQRCDGPGGNVCFSINGAVDPAAGDMDFFSLYDLVAHETGHCLTVGHVGDGADGPWGPTPTNDIMAYSIDPVDRNKCVSTLDVEGFALTMSEYLDVNGDGKVDAKDRLAPNSTTDGTDPFQVQHPQDHWYASPTGLAEDCPQPDTGLVPLGEETDWEPATVATTTPRLALGAAKGERGRLTWSATAIRAPKAAAPTARAASATDPAGDGVLPVTDLTGLRVSTTPDAVKAVLQLDRLLPSTDSGRVTAYGLVVGGRQFDSTVTTQSTGGQVQTVDVGTGTVLPAGSSTWDLDKGTVSFSIPRSYLAGQRITAPYAVFARTTVHARANDSVTGLDRAPDAGTVRVAAAAARTVVKEAPMATRSTTRTIALENPGGNAFTPADTSTSGVPLVPAAGNDHRIPLPVKEQSTVAVTLTWEDPASSLGLTVRGGSGQEVVSEGSSVTVTVPWAHRDLAVTVIPSQIGAPSVPYTLSAKVTTLTANADRDGVPDVADLCRTAAGPVASAGCPDTDRDGVLDVEDRCATAAAVGGCPTAGSERVVALLDGRQVSATPVMTRHGRYDVAGTVAARRGTHTLELVWYSGTKALQTVSRTVTVR